MKAVLSRHTKKKETATSTSTTTTRASEGRERSENEDGKERKEVKEQHQGSLVENGSTQYRWTRKKIQMWGKRMWIEFCCFWVCDFLGRRS